MEIWDFNSNLFESKKNQSPWFSSEERTDTGEGQGRLGRRDCTKVKLRLLYKFLVCPWLPQPLAGSNPKPRPPVVGCAEVLMSLQMLPSLVELLCLTKLGLQQLLLPGSHALQQNFLIWKSLFHPIWAERIQSLI